MPKKSAAELATGTPDKRDPPVLLTPGTHLAPEVSAIFIEIRDSMARDHFVPADRVLLEQLAMAVFLARELSAALIRDGIVIAGKPNQAARHLRQQQQVIATLSTKLRITAQSRVSKRAAARSATVAPMTIAEIYEMAR